MNNNICKTALLRGGEVIPLIIPTEFSKGTGLTNPSILKTNGKLLLNINTNKTINFFMIFVLD